MKRSFLSPRVATALAAIPVVLVIIWFGGWLFKAISLLLAMIALGELSGALRQAHEKGQGAKLVGVVAYPALFALFWWAPGGSFLLPLVIFGALCTVAVLAYGPTGKISLQSISLTLAATMYCGLFAFLPLLRNHGDGKSGFALFCLTIFSVWASDTAAYYGGRALGRRPLTPLSPGKTREGAIFGAIAAIIVATGIAWGAHFSFLQGPLFGIVIAIAAPLGDLIESFWKRELGVKDLGTILPGHGGVLDRCDSLIFAAFAVYLVAPLN